MLTKKAFSSLLDFESMISNQVLVRSIFESISGRIIFQVVIGIIGPAPELPVLLALCIYNASCAAKQEKSLRRVELLEGNVLRSFKKNCKT